MFLSFVLPKIFGNNITLYKTMLWHFDDQNLSINLSNPDLNYPTSFYIFQNQFSSYKIYTEKICIYRKYEG